MIKYLLIPILGLALNACYKKEKIVTKNPPQEITKDIEAKFLPNNSDIPLFTGFKIIEEDTLNFDSSSGYINDITYQSDSKIDEINNYYENNLKNLGWKKTTESINHISFERDNEMLKITYDLRDNKLIVKFFIINNG